MGAKTGSAQVGSADKEADAVLHPIRPPMTTGDRHLHRGGGRCLERKSAQAAGEIVNYYFSVEHTVESVDAENTLLR